MDEGGADSAESVQKCVKVGPIDIDFDDIDDKEFDIPAVDKAPTLESILSAPDDDIALSVYGATGTQYNTPAAEQAGETSSISSHDDVSVDHTNLQKSQPLQKSLRYTKHGAILRHVILKVASAQIVSAADRVDAGLPTALAASLLLAVGTSHGIVLVFDSRQTLRWCLGGAAGVGAEFGAVSALGLNGDCSRLLVGYARGQVTMWDLTNGKLLRTVTDAHPPGVAVLHVKFTDDRTVAVMSDSGGSVFSLEFKRLIGVRTCDSQCLFSGSRGEVCVIEPLCLPFSSVDQSSHPARQVLLLAMASLSKILIVTMRPDLRVRYVHTLAGDAATLPLLSWHFVVIQLSDNEKVIDPVLAYARDQTVHFVQVMCRGFDDIKVVPLQKIELCYKLLSISWLNSRTMLFIDTAERAHLIDVRSEENVEVVDLGDVHLVYSSSFYKSLATGGNVSPALAYAGERAIYQSVITSGSQLVLLGTKGLHVLVLRTWNERLDQLLKQEHYPEALSLARSFYEGSAYCVVGLTSSIDKRHELIAVRIMYVLTEYVDLAMTKLCPSHGRMEELQAYYQDVVAVCVDNCLLVKRTDFLFGRLYDRFSADAIAKAMYLESLEPYIRNDTLTSVTPSVMKDFVDYYEQRGALAAVGECILHMDVASLDIHQVVSLCWAHGLYDAILYIYNCAMADYTTPLEELLALLAAAVATGKQLTYNQIQLGNKILVYISCCLAGRAYPRGNIPVNQVAAVKDQMLNCVTALHTSSPRDSEPAYPHLRTLLLFDTREFFNVLALSFEDVDLKLKEKQRIVDILLLLMVESVGFTPTQVGILFTFLTRQMARHGNDLAVNRTLFEQVVESLCVSKAGGAEEGYRHEERQQAVLELYAAGGLIHFDRPRLLELAESAGFFRVCEVVYESHREFDKIVSCYWRDPARGHLTVGYIQRVLTDQSVTEDEKERVRRVVFEDVEQLIRIDARRVAKLVLVTMRIPVSDVINKFGNQHEDAVLEFLSRVFEFIQTSVVDTQQTPIEPHVFERYVELLCRHSSQAEVVKFLQSTSGYEVEEMIAVCKRYSVTDALVFLLEKSGKIDEAFSLALETLNVCLMSVVAHQSDLSKLESQVLEVIRLLQRSSKLLEPSDRERLWFVLLDSLVDAVRSTSNKSPLSSRLSYKESSIDSDRPPLTPVIKDSVEESLKLATKHVINAMMSHVALPAILQRIVTTDGSGVAATFGNVRDLLSGVLESCAYERTLLDTCARLVHDDLYKALVSMVTSVRRGTSSCEQCVVCKRLCMTSSDDVTNKNANSALVSFRCGHTFHQVCLGDGCLVLSPNHSANSPPRFQCLICAQTSCVRSKPPTNATTSSRRSPSSPTKRGDALESVQLSSMELLRSMHKTPSRLSLLTELAQLERSRHVQSQRAQKTFSSTGGMLFNEMNVLRLAPPPPPVE